MKKAKLVVFVLVITLLNLDSVASAQTVNENWSSMSGGVNGSVCALASDGSGNVYAGGMFVNYISKWDGSSWSVLGDGLYYDMGNGVFSNAFGGAYVLACDRFGNLYAAGRFNMAGDVSVNNIAKWDGSSWSALDGGCNGDVNALACDSLGNLYAGGIFETIGGASTNDIAKWNGNSWSALGSGINEVTALICTSSGILYAAGTLSTIGGGNVYGIAKWDGSSWSVLGSGSGLYGMCIWAFAFDALGNLYAGGTFDTIGGVSAHDIAKWNGNSWSALGSGVSYCVKSLALDGSGNIYAGGTGGPGDYLAVWNGNSWNAGGVNNVVWALTSDHSGNVYAGGEFDTAGGVIVKNIAELHTNAVTKTLNRLPPTKKADYGNYSSAGQLFDLRGRLLNNNRHVQNSVHGINVMVNRVSGSKAVKMFIR